MSLAPYFNSKEYGEQLVRGMLGLIGDDPARGGLVDTPARVVKAWTEWFSGYGQDPAELFKTFEDGAEKADEIVLLTNIPVHTHCEHHITPIIGHAHVAYIPNGKIVGISKLARLVDLYARRLQVQERLTNQIADAIEEHLQPQAVGVIITAKHFCMATRGVKMPTVDTTTSAMRGAFREDPASRAELLTLIQLSS
jgi:GTP cyclohydrolase IA